ncbi:MAG: phosphatase PAP2 family protein [Anaerolineales bacterium]|nr:phosphatase PAP2 family protein [Anaerolineales bacterium]
MNKRTHLTQPPTWFLPLSLITGLLSLLLTFVVLGSSLLQGTDERLYHFFKDLQTEMPPWLITTATWFQNATSVGMGIVVTLLLIVWLLQGRTRRFWLLLASTGGAELLWLALVFGLGRPRPQEVFIWGGVSVPSYPSGHVLVNVAFYGALVYIFYPRLSRLGRWLAGIAAVGILLLIGLNRLFFSVHYVSDVAAGFLLGIAWSAGLLWLVDHNLDHPVPRHSHNQ